MEMDRDGISKSCRSGSAAEFIGSQPRKAGHNVQKSGDLLEFGTLRQSQCNHKTSSPYKTELRGGTKVVNIMRRPDVRAAFSIYEVGRVSACWAAAFSKFRA